VSTRGDLLLRLAGRRAGYREGLKQKLPQELPQVLPLGLPQGLSHRALRVHWSHRASARGCTVALAFRAVAAAAAAAAAAAEVSKPAESRDLSRTPRGWRRRQVWGRVRSENARAASSQRTWARRRHRSEEDEGVEEEEEEEEEKEVEKKIRDPRKREARVTVQVGAASEKAGVQGGGCPRGHVLD